MSEQIFHVGIKALIQNDDGEVLLILNRFPDRELWDIPGGRMDEGEEIIDTLKRELKEEISAEIEKATGSHEYEEFDGLFIKAENIEEEKCFDRR